MYFYAKHENPKNLSKFFKSFENIIDDFNLKVNKTGVSVKAMNSTHTSIIDSFLDSRDFEKFELYNDISSFSKIINTAETIDSIIFEIKSKNEDVLNITFENKFRKCNYKLKLLDINCEEICDIKLTYDLEMDINMRRFIKIVQDIDVISPENICFNTDVSWSS